MMRHLLAMPTPRSKKFDKDKLAIRQSLKAFRGQRHGRAHAQNTQEQAEDFHV